MRPAAWLACALAFGGGAASAEEFSFDASQFEKKPYELGGYVELRPERFRFDRDGAYYKLNHPGASTGDSLRRTTATFKPSGKLRLGEGGSFNFRAHLDEQRDDIATSRTKRFDEANFSYKPSPGFTLDAGKTVQKWGKGYAWNPVAFVERPKDPNDPELAREGYTMVTADWIRHLDGPLQTVALTPVLLPVSAETNRDFGAPGHVNVAAKLYLLYRDTDIDFVFLGQGSRTRRAGVDFSRNLGSNLEIHGEWSRSERAQRPVLDPFGSVTQQEFSANSYLVGLRYLTERDTTYIAEIYRNGAGYTRAEADAFYGLVDRAAAQYGATGGTALLGRAQTLAQGGYGRPNAGRNYLYLRISQKEPFDLLYFTPAVTIIANADDRSASIVPEALYTGFTNVELRLRVFALAGGTRTEFGEKLYSNRIELLARLYF